MRVDTADTIHSVAKTLNDAGFLKVLFPVLAAAGPGLFFYFGYLGVVKRRTLALARTRGTSGGGGWVTGGWAIAFGIIYLLVAPVMLIAMGPIAAAMLGLW